MAIRKIKDMDCEEIVALLHEDDDFRRKIEDRVIDLEADEIIYQLNKAPKWIEWEVDKGFQTVRVYPRFGVNECVDFDTLRWIKNVSYEMCVLPEEDEELLKHIHDLMMTDNGVDVPDIEDGIENLLDTLSIVFTTYLTDVTDVCDMAEFIMANIDNYGDMEFGEADEDVSGGIWEWTKLDVDCMKERGLDFNTFCEWYEYIEYRLDYLKRHNYNLTKRQYNAIDEIADAFFCMTNC